MSKHMKIVKVAEVVEVDGVQFTAETLRSMVLLANAQATIQVLRIGAHLFFKEIEG